MERDSFAGALQRRWWVVVLTTLLGAFAGAAPVPERVADTVSSFSATHTLLLTSNDPLGVVSSDTISPSQIVLLATTGDVPKLVAEQIGYAGNPATLASQVQIDLDGGTNSLQISTNQSTPEQAVAIADGFAKILTSFLATRQDTLREQRLAASLTRLASLETQIAELSKEAITNPDDPLVKAKLDAASRRYSVVFEQFDNLQEAATTINLVTLESAQPIAIESQGLRAPGSRRSRGLFGAMAGAAIGLAAVLVLNFFDRRIRQRAQAEAILGVPVQLTIPVARKANDRGVAVRRERHDRISDTYRAMRSVLNLAHADRADLSRAPVTLVLSAGPGDGKTTASANIAAAFAEAGTRTIAINADFRRPALGKLLGVSNATGAEEDLRKDNPERVSPMVRGLRLHDERLVDRDSTPGDLARKTVQMLPSFTRKFDAVVIDTPPVSLAAEVLELLPHADTIVVMVRLGHTRIDAAAKTAETLRALGITNFLLVVIGGATDRGFNYYGYGYGRSYNQGAPRGGRPERELAQGPGPDPSDAF